MIRILPFILAMLLAACAATGPAPQVPHPYFAPAGEGHLGLRSLDDEDWEPVDFHGNFDLRGVVPVAQGPLAFEFGAGYSQDDNEIGDTASVEGAIWELHAGLRGTVPIRGTRVALIGGVGLSGLYGKYETLFPAAVERDWGHGWYGEVGFHVRLDEGYLGLVWRTVEDADMDLGFGVDDADYSQVSLVLGGFL